ncbi:hypothetical protein AB0I28_07825 [Phytomonospora sp. NPDC050363]|uniref:hypothetical protein n=1 Tax=Phytomonospora sp. NPDC050363 TaxID=3155642 RepID=UPI00340E8B18
MSIHDVLPHLPEPEALRSRLRAMAVLDAAFNPTYPRHLYWPRWRPGVAMASMDNGGGDSYGVVFDPAGVLLFGFDHESEVSPWRDDDHEHWPGLLDGLPAALATYPADEELLFEDFFDATAVAWWTADGGWACGPVTFGDEDDGAGWLFGLATATDAPRAYADWAGGYFGRKVDPRNVAWAFAGEPMTRADVDDLGGDWEKASAEAARMGYPVKD